jgi:nitrogen fixation NifU-like protein
MKIPSLYSKEIMKHFKTPRNVGVIKNPDGTGRVGNVQCVMPSVNVWSNPSLIPIQEIRSNQLVFSHDGRYNRVTQTHFRSYNGKLVVIKNRLGKILLTPEHLLFSMKVPKCDYYLRTKNKKTLPVGWYHAEDLQKGDVLLYPIISKTKDIEEIPINIKKFKYDFRSKTIPVSIKVDKKFLKLVGYFVAEGHASIKITSSSVSFALHINERKIASEIVSIIKDIFNFETRIIKDEDKNSMKLIVNSSILARFFRSLFGSNAENKHIPHEFLQLPVEKQKYIIYGLWKGDGYVNVRRKGPRAEFSTVSYLMAQQLKTLLLRQGVICSLYTEAGKKRKGVYHQTAYRLHIGEKNSLEKICEILGIKWKSKNNEQKKSWISNNYLFTPITKIETKKYRGIVHNLEVKNSRSFVTDCATLHNCGDIMELYIKVKKDKIADIKFQTFGCVVALAVSSMLTEMTKGKALEDAIKITNKDILKKSGPVPPIKIHCSVLAADALHEAIYNYYSKNKKEIPESLKREHERIQNTLKQVEETHKEFTEFEEKILNK